jgi:hypothetical protein
VQFGLQFEEVIEGEEEPTPANVQEPPAARTQKKRLPATPAPTATTEPAPAATRSAPGAKREKPQKPVNGGGEIVRLDRFRKK